MTTPEQIEKIIRENEEMEKLKSDFQEWYLLQFGQCDDFSFNSDGYKNDHANLVWIGFCGGRLTA